MENKISKNIIVVIGVCLVAFILCISFATMQANSAPVDYTVTYDVSAMCSNTPAGSIDEGGCNATEPAAQDVSSGSYITLPDYTGTRPGWTFAGWTTQNNPALLVDNTRGSKAGCPAPLNNPGDAVQISTDTVYYGCWIDETAPDWSRQWEDIGDAHTGSPMPYSNLYWLRSPGYCGSRFNCSASTVKPNGEVDPEGQVVTSESISVRPALTVSLDLINTDGRRLRPGDCLARVTDDPSCIKFSGSVNGVDKEYSFDIVGIYVQGHSPQGICQSLATDGYGDYDGGECPVNTAVILLSDSSVDKLDDYMQFANGAFGVNTNYNAYATSNLKTAMDNAYFDLSTLTLANSSKQLQDVIIPRKLISSNVRNMSTPVNTIYNDTDTIIDANFYPLSSYEAKYIKDFSFNDMPAYEYTYRDKISVSVNNIARTATIQAQRTCDVDTDCQVTQQNAVSRYLTEYDNSYWLRTSDHVADYGYSVSNYASLVGTAGFVYSSGISSDSPYSVRPALLADLGTFRTLKPTLTPGYCVNYNDNTPSCVTFGDVSFDVIGVNDSGNTSGVCTLTDTSGYTAPTTAECPNNTVMLLLSAASKVKPAENTFRTGAYPYTATDNNYGQSPDNSNEESDLKISIDAFYNSIKGNLLANSSSITLDSVTISRTLKGGATVSDVALGENAGNSVLGGDVAGVYMYPLSALEADTAQKLGKVSQIDYGPNAEFTGPQTSAKSQLRYRVAWSSTPITSCSEGTALTDWTNDSTKGLGDLTASVTVPSFGRYYYVVCAKDLAGNISAPRTGIFDVSKTDVVINSIKINDKIYDGNTDGSIATTGQTAYIWQRAGNPLPTGYDDVQVDFSSATVKFENELPSDNQVSPAITGKTRAVITGLKLKGGDANLYNLLTFEIPDGILAANTGIEYGWVSSARISSDSPLLAPNATIDYENETLTGLLPNQNVQIERVDGTKTTLSTTSNGDVAIPSGLIPETTATDISISLRNVVSSTSTSPEQIIVIAKRPAEPVLQVSDAHLPQNNDGEYQITAPSGFNYEHRQGLSGSWSALGAGVDEKSGLSSGQYQVRVSASNLNSNFASRESTVTIGALKKPLTLNGNFIVENKQYDGNNSAVLMDNLPDLDGLVPSWQDVQISLSVAFATFADSSAGNGKDVVVSGVKITGNDAANYELTIPDLPVGLQGITADNKGFITTADITPKTVNVVIDPVIVVTGNAPQILDQHYRVEGFLPGDTFDQLSNIVVDNACAGLTIAGVAGNVGEYSNCVIDDPGSPFTVNSNYSLQITYGTLIVRPVNINTVEPETPGTGISVTDPDGRIPGDSCLYVQSLNNANNPIFNALNDEITALNQLHKAWDIKLLNCTTKIAVSLDHYVNIVIANAEFKDDSTVFDVWHKHGSDAADKLPREQFDRRDNSLTISTNRFSVFGYSYTVSDNQDNSEGGQSEGSSHLAPTGASLGDKLMLICLLLILLGIVRSRQSRQ